MSKFDNGTCIADEQGPWLVYTGPVARTGTLLSDGRVLDETFDWQIPTGTPVTMYGAAVGVTIRESWTINQIIHTRFVVRKQYLVDYVEEKEPWAFYPTIEVNSINCDFKVRTFTIENETVHLFTSGTVSGIAIVELSAFPSIDPLWWQGINQGMQPETRNI